MKKGDEYMRINKYIKLIAIFLLPICFFNCSNDGDMLEDFLSQGPVIYAAKIDSMDCQSGLRRIRVNIKPAEDVNRSHCMLKWNITSEIQDSLTVEYNDANFDKERGYYFTVIDLGNSDIQGNLEIRAQNIDSFGNKSLVFKVGAYVYGDIYVSSLLNDAVYVSEDRNTISFDRKLGSVGNFISYQQLDGSFTEEVFVKEDTFSLVNAKPGGIIKNKTRYLVHEKDIDTLDAKKYQETIIP